MATNSFDSSVNDSQSPLVLVTGASGFIAKHTIKLLLESGYRVRGTIRNKEEAEIAKKAQAKTKMHHQKNHLPNFSVVTADLTADEGWYDAVRGCDYVIHLASPYPLKSPAGPRDVLVPMAKGGTIRVVKKALQEKSVKKIVVVSSVLAMQYRENRPRPVVNITEDSWTDPNWKAVPAYPYSKALAERAAWDLASKYHAKDRMVAVNLGMVWGPMLDNHLSTSSEICQRVMSGKYPWIPKAAYPIVDVRDAALLLVKSLGAPKVGGRRLIACSETVSFEEIVQYLRTSHPQFADKLSTTVAPYWLLWPYSFFDKSLEIVLLDYETVSVYDSQYVTELTGVTFRPAKEAICTMAQSLIDNKLIDPRSTVETMLDTAIF